SSFTSHRSNRMKTLLVLPLLLAVGCSALNPDVAGGRITPANSAVAQARDERVRVSIDSVLIRNAPGAWVRDADWDEYRIVIETAGRPVEVNEVVLVDA